MSPPLPDVGDPPPPSQPGREILRGGCVCGAAAFTLDVTPSAGHLTLSAYCHCTRCQRSHGAPFTHTTHWKRDAVIWTSESPKRDVASFELVPGVKWKLRCAGECGVQLGSWNETKQEWSIWPAQLARNGVGRVIGIDRMRPTAHQFYGEWRAMDMEDDLPRYVGYQSSSPRVG